MSTNRVNNINNLSQNMDKLSVNGDTPNGQTPEDSTPKNRQRSNRKKKQQTAKDKPILLSDIGGYDKQIASLKDLIELPLNNNSNTNQVSLHLPKTVLVFGPSGTGKTMTIKAFCNELNQKMFCVNINCATILAKTFSVSEENLRTIFTTAIEMSPSLVFLDNFDMICSNKKSNTDQEKRLAVILCSILDELPKDKHIIVIVVTSKPDSIESCLRRPGRIDREIDFGVPLPSERFKILRKHMNLTNSMVNDEELIALAQTAHSFTGADLGLVCREAALIVLKDKRQSITSKDLKQGLKSVRPSAMREISLEVPNVFWSEIGGMQVVRSKLTQCVVWPLTNPEAFERLGIEAPKGVLMYGPPGCCKTMIGKALATESGLNFLAIKGPELFNKWVGESERAVREVFRKAKAASPSILFFDEIDALAAERGAGQSTVGDRVLATLLTEIDGIEKLNGVVIVAATNRPDMIDKALLRPGRLDSIIYVPLPDMQTRYEILKIRTRKMAIAFEQPVEEALQHLATVTDGYTGAEISAICQESGLIALETDINCQSVRFEHFIEAMKIVKPRINRETILFYEKYKNECNESIKIKN